MCTVTYLPLAGGFILTHNRDEAPTRSPQAISRVKTAGDILLFPRDTKAGGGWIATARSSRTACLLNGAFIKHRHEPPYRRSRGLVLLDFFDWESPDAFLEQYELEGIEPFTFLFFADAEVAELRWDGQQRHLKKLPPDKPYFWCSSTLYPPDMQARRDLVFRDWLAQQAATLPDPRALMYLHRTGSVGDPENDFVMNRGGKVCTVSITQIIFQKKIARMRYFDLLEGHRDKRQILTRER